MNVAMKEVVSCADNNFVISSLILSRILFWFRPLNRRRVASSVLAGCDA